jgi:hypothetical protein
MTSSSKWVDVSVNASIGIREAKELLNLSLPGFHAKLNT